MDLAAYLQIELFDEIAKKNGIQIPRLRGYRLMKDEKALNAESFTMLFNLCEIDAVDMLCRAEPFWNLPRNPGTRSYGSYTDRRKYYLQYGIDKEGERTAIGIRWDRIHGKKRRILKYEIKKNKRNALKQFSIWNKYAGRDDVLYIHSRMGNNNWENYDDKDTILNAPWFLDRVDDWWDGTYCDFYAKIDPTLSTTPASGE